MKNIIYFFAGLALVALILAALFFGAVLFDTAGVAQVRGFIFQPNNLAAMRVGAPIPLDETTDSFVRDRLIRKYVGEYLRVIPDATYMESRRHSRSILAAMSAPEAFTEWDAKIAPALEKLAADGVLRRVIVHDIVLAEDYYMVSYELLTWDSPNAIEVLPKSTRGIMHLQLYFEKAMWETVDGRIDGMPFDAGKYLESGRDPAGMFRFKVRKVVQ